MCTTEDGKTALNNVATLAIQGHCVSLHLNGYALASVQALNCLYTIQTNTMHKDMTVGGLQKRNVGRFSVNPESVGGNMFSVQDRRHAQEQHCCGTKEMVRYQAQVSIASYCSANFRPLSTASNLNKRLEYDHTACRVNLQQIHVVFWLFLTLPRTL